MAKEKVKKEKVSRPKPVLNFFIKTLNGMAYGLFATLIIGTVLGTIAGFFPHGEDASKVCKFFYTVLNGGSNVLSTLTGAGIGVGIALALQFDALKTIVIAAVGEIASYFCLSTAFVTSGVTADKFKVGDPLTVYFVVILVCLAFKYVLRKKTPVDIILIPLFGSILGVFLSLGIRYPSIYVTYGIQWLVGEATFAQPFIMGIIISVIMGMALTAPISSAAIAAVIFTATGSNVEGLKIASGAAIIGCCTQMVGFAVQSAYDNDVGKVISVGIGTSMLQFKNILKKPIVWLPTIIASAILGPIATTVLHVECMGSSAGMGTAGLVGQIGTITSMGTGWQVWLIIILFEVVAPAVLVFLIDLIFRKTKLIKKGDLTI